MEKEIALVVAASLNNVIGREGQLPWKLRDDMALFKQTTMGHPVIMGRKTFESLGKPLPGRTNIVVSRSVFRPGTELGSVAASDYHMATSLEDALLIARQSEGSERICIIGGGQIYEQALALANVVYLSRVKVEVEGDAFFPYLDEAKWRVVEEVAYAADARNEFGFYFQKWVRV